MFHIHVTENKERCWDGKENLNCNLVHGEEQRTVQSSVSGQEDNDADVERNSNKEIDVLNGHNNGWRETQNYWIQCSFIHLQTGRSMWLKVQRRQFQFNFLRMDQVMLLFFYLIIVKESLYISYLVKNSRSF